MPNLTVTELDEAAVAAQIERENELDAVNGGQEPGDIEGQEPHGQQDEGRADGDGGEPTPREKPIQMSPQDQKREAMANRFKRPGVEEVPFDGDLTKAENLYGAVAAEELEPDPDLPEPGVPAADQQQQPAAAERNHKIIVRGKEMLLTDAELIERASKVEAADSYLAESREMLDAAKRVRAERAGLDPQHPEDRRSTEDGQDQTDHSDRARHPALDLKSVVEEIQFGDPEKASTLLGEAINTAASKMANEGHIARLVSNDLAKSKLELKAFSDANPDVASNEIAASVMEQSIYKVFREEIKALGVDEAQIPRDPKALADWHRLYRVHGHNVSKPADVFQKAKAKLDEFRGAPSVPKPAPRKDASRVEVNVNRTERRMAIPVQPSRAVAPQRNAAPVKVENSRKDAVAEMRKARGQPVG
jgi:hypothetical protein